MEKKFTHFDENGKAVMVDVTEKKRQSGWLWQWEQSE